MSGKANNPLAFLSAMAKLALLFSMLLFSILSSAPPAGPAAADPTLVLERTIQLTKVKGRIDHMAVDLTRRHLLVAELGNHTVDIVDFDKGEVVHRLSGLKEPQGIAYDQARDLIVVSNAGDGSVRLFRADDLRPVGAIALGDDADNIRVDPRHDKVFVGYGNGGLAVVDPINRSWSAVTLAAHPEAFEIDPATDQAFVNVPQAHQVAVIDLASHQQVAIWRFPGLEANFPMALGDNGGALAIVFRNPATLVILDTKTGATLEDLATCGDADDVFFDDTRRRVYVSCGEGHVDVFGRGAAGYHRLERIKTSPGARTSLFDRKLDRLFVAVGAGPLNSRAAILVFRPSSLVAR